MRASSGRKALLLPFKKALLLPLLLLVSSCHAQNDPKAETISYQYVTHQDQVDDDKSPLGYWEINHRYPVFENHDASALVDDLNNRVAETLAEFHCPEGGDETFTAEVAPVTEGELDIEYEAMWMCASMPSPDHTSGSLSFDIAEGTTLRQQ